jgi:hypothetical protein
MSFSIVRVCHREVSGFVSSGGKWMSPDCESLNSILHYSKANKANWHSHRYDLAPFHIPSVICAVTSIRSAGTRETLMVSTRFMFKKKLNKGVHQLCESSA